VSGKARVCARGREYTRTKKSIISDSIQYISTIFGARHDRSLGATTNIASHPTLPSNIGQITFRLPIAPIIAAGGAAFRAMPGQGRYLGDCRAR
jgi:hypothetical protein